MIKVTPKEAWSKKKPNVSHLKIFGSVAYDDVMNIKLLVVGYVVHVKTDRLLESCTNKAVVSKEN